MNMKIDISTFLQLSKEKEKVVQNDLMSHKALVPVTYDDYLRLIKDRAEMIFLERGIPRKFVVDLQNAEIIKQLYYYLTDHPHGKLNPHVGILMTGGVGSGKTVLMRAHCEVSNLLTTKVISYIHAETMVDLIKKNGEGPYLKKPILIDELGKEVVIAKNYGEVLKPITDLFALRYDTGARTYATSNYNLNSLEEIYGKFIRSRIEEMMNWIELKGDSRRFAHRLK